jgi:single-strand DNA-binding protein
MAYFHKMVVIGKLVRDPVVRSFANGGRVAKFGLPVDFTRRKKNPQTGQWEGESFIIDVDVFNRPDGKVALADLVEQYLRKGSQVYVEGRLKPNEYTDKNGVKVFKPVLVADTIQFLDGRPNEGGDDEMRGGSSPSYSSSAPRRGPSAPPSAPPEPSYDDMEPPPEGGGKNPQDDIPF